MKIKFLTLLLLCSSGAASASTFTAKGYIGAVLAASPAMRKADLVFRQAENNYRSALADAVLPGFTLTLGQTFYDNYDTRLRFDSEDRTSSLSAAWNLYDSANGPLKRVKAARQDFASARLAYDSARQAEALKALSRFYALYGAQRRVGTARNNLSSRERSYKETNEQFQSGTRSRTEVTQSEGDKLQSELSVAQAEAAAVKALLSFNELLDAEPETPRSLEVSSSPAEVKLPPPGEDVAQALRNNISVRQQRLSLERSRLSNSVTRLANLPRLRVDASWRKSGLGIAGERGYGGYGNPAYSLGASLSLPFGFLGAQNYLDYKTAESADEAAEQDLRSAERSLKAAVLSSRKDIELNSRSLKLLEFQLKAQQSAAGAMASEYSLGGVGFLQLDSAQTKLLDASNAQIAAFNDLDLALANYRALLGERIWE